jgi:hypothetical protein
MSSRVEPGDSHCQRSRCTVQSFDSLDFRRSNDQCLPRSSLTRRRAAHLFARRSQLERNKRLDPAEPAGHDDGLMVLALVLLAQVTTSPPQNPCLDQLVALCRISPYFCPGAYPANLVPGTSGIPCWPERQPVASSASPQRERQAEVVHRSQSITQAEQAQRAAPSGSTSRQSPAPAAGLTSRPPERLSFLRRLFGALKP